MNYPIDAQHAGVSDKYGNVYVERTGIRGFEDWHEPVALFRATDKHALKTLLSYYNRLANDKDVTEEQLALVNRQITLFRKYANEYPMKMRTPGGKKEVK